MDDLAPIKKMYGKIIANMDANQINIWDDIYPCEFFKEDITNERLYLLVDEQGAMMAAFALCGESDGAGSVEWEKKDARALYLDRLGVHADYMRKGIGQAALQQAALLAGQRGAEYLRLFVVAENEPAIRLYQKAGFKQAAGMYDEVINEDLTLHEYGFEIKI